MATPPSNSDATMGQTREIFPSLEEATLGAVPALPDDALSVLTVALGTSAIEVLEERYSAVPRGFDAALTSVRHALDPASKVVDFEALERSVAQEFEVDIEAMPAFLCSLVLGDDAAITRSDFPVLYRSLLLLVGRLAHRIPGFHYKCERAESFVASEGSEPFTGFKFLKETCLLRLDIKGSVKARLKRGLSMVDVTEAHYYRPILEVLKLFPEVHYVETAGDEAVFLCDDPEIAKLFAWTIQQRFVLDSELSVEIGLTLHGPAYYGITTEGRFLVGGESYVEAGRIQKFGKKREADDIEAASGIFVKDFRDGRVYPLDSEDDGVGSSLLSADLGSARSLLGSTAMASVGGMGLNSSHVLARLNVNDPELSSQMERVIALLASTAIDPKEVLSDREVLYPRATLLFVDVTPPAGDSVLHSDEVRLQHEWEVFMQSFESVVRQQGGTVLYTSSEGKIIVLFGAFQSSALDQEKRAVVCAGQLLERFSAIKRISCAADRLAQGAMAGSYNGAGLGLDFAARLLGVPAEGVLVMEREFFEAVLARSGLLFMNERYFSCEVRDFGTRELVSFAGVKAPSMGPDGNGEYAELLREVSERIHDLTSAEAAPGAHLFCVQAESGISPDSFLEALKSQLYNGGAQVVSPSEEVQSHRAYGFFREIFQSAFPTSESVESFFSEVSGPHEVWRFLIREISSGRISATLLQNPELVEDSLRSLIMALATVRPLVLQLPPWNRLDAFSVPIVSALLGRPAVTGHLVILASEKPPLESLAEPSVTIELARLDEAGLRAYLAAELGITATDIEPEVISFYGRMISEAPWIPFLVRGLTRFLIHEQYLVSGRGDFSKSVTHLSSTDVPGTFDHYVHALFTPLSSNGREVFCSAALLGASGDTGVLRVLSPLEDTEFDAVMEELHLAGILNVASGRYRFFHDFVPRIAPRLFMQQGSESAAHLRILDELCTLVGKNPSAVSPHVLMEKAVAAGSSERIAPQMAEVLGAMVREKPLDVEALAIQYLSSLEGKVLSSEQRVAVLNINMHLILAKAQLRRPYDDRFKKLVEESDGLRQHLRLTPARRGALDAEWALLLHDAGDVLRERDLARQGATLLMGVDEGVLSGFGVSLRHEIEAAKARIEYRQRATPNTLPYDDRVAAAQSALRRVELILSDSSGLSVANFQRFKVLSFVIRGFLAVDLVNGLLQGAPRPLSSQEEEVIDALLVEVSVFCDEADSLALRERMGCAHILSMGHVLRKRLDDAHAVLDELWERVEQQGQLGFKAPLMNLKMVAYGEALANFKKAGDLSSILRLAEALEPFVAFIEEHRQFLTADESLLFFYLNLIEFKYDIFESLPSDHGFRSDLRVAVGSLLESRIPVDCAKHVQLYQRSIDRAKVRFSKMQ